MNQALFASLSPVERAMPFSHPDYGTLTVDWIVQLLESHLTHHVAHFEQIARSASQMDAESIEPRESTRDSASVRAQFTAKK
jgi:hypothetical protein